MVLIVVLKIGKIKSGPRSGHSVFLWEKTCIRASFVPADW